MAATFTTVEWSCVGMRHRGKMFSSRMKEKKIEMKQYSDTVLMRIRAEPSFRTCAVPHTRNPIRKTRSNVFFVFSSMCSAMLCNVCISVSVLFCVSRCFHSAPFILKLLMSNRNIERVDGIHPIARVILPTFANKC